MSTVACSKEFTLTINPSGPPVDAYWTIDNPGSEVFSQFRQLDQVNNVSLTSAFFDFQGPPYETFPTTGGLYGNAMGWTTNSGPFAGGWQTNSEPHLAFTGTGWSLVFWFKVLFWPNANLFGNGPAIEFDVGSNIISDSSCLIDIGINDLNAFPVGVIPQPNMVSFFINDSVGTDTIAPAAFSPSLNVWHMLHVFYTKSTGTFGYSLDNGANVTVTGIQCDNGPSSLFAFVYNWSGANANVNWLLTDEFALKLSRILTGAEVTYLFNSGVGRTWPLTGFP